MKHTTIKPVLKTWVKPDSNNEFGLYLRLTKDRKTSYVYLGIKCNQKLWNADSGKVKNEHKQSMLLNSIIDQKIQEYRIKVLSNVNSKTDQSVLEIKADVEFEYTNTSVGILLTNRIQQLHEAGKMGNKAVYNDLLKSLSKFTLSKKNIPKLATLSFIQIDYPFLIAYESFLYMQKNTASGISIKMRTLRALYNDAIKLKVVDRENYPFTSYSISKRLKSDAKHVAITKLQIDKIKSLSLTLHSTKFEAQQYFLFSYYGLGINLTDIANLKWSSIYGNKISYIRQKTGKRINFPITDNITLILEYFKPVGAIDATSFIFPILNQDIHKSPSQIKDRINKVNKRVNKDLKEFAVICDININLHFYIARHTMASTLKKAGQSITAIKEIMGHEDERTTQGYLDSLDDEIFTEAANLL